MLNHKNAISYNTALSPYVKILLHDVPLGVIAEFHVGHVTLQVIHSLARVEVHLRLPVHRFVVHFGRLSWRVFLDFAVKDAKRSVQLCKELLCLKVGVTEGFTNLSEKP